MALTKKDNFKWGPDTQATFERLKQAMVTTPVLQLLDFTQPFDIECDGSSFKIGAALMQNHHPIPYFSKGLFDRNLLKLAYEREIMALALVVQHWRPYLLSREFKVFFSGQKSLRYLLHQHITIPDQLNWGAKLLGYKFEIIYRP